MSTCSSAPLPPPEEDQSYTLIKRQQTSHNTCLLQFRLPNGRHILGSDPTLPTCLKVTLPGGTDVYGTGVPTSETDVSKSYSPISHPSTKGVFELLVKAYPQRNGGGLGAYLCSLEPEGNESSTAAPTSVQASVKPPRSMHGSPTIYNRWKHVGLIAGGTGIAPLFQIAKMLLEDPSGYTTDIRLLFFNKSEEDILLRDQIDELVKSSGGRLRVTYALTSSSRTDNNDGPSNNGGRDDWGDGDDTGDRDDFRYGRGSVEMARDALPPPMGGDGTTMVLVCGTDGFVEMWGGPVVRGPRKKDGSKGPKIQGPLLGILNDSGYRDSEVFKY